MNKILKILILSDIFLLSGFAFMNPVFAIFINEQIAGGTLFAVGMASAIYLISHALLQIAFSYKFNPKDRYWMLILGTIIFVLTPIGFIFSTKIWQVYALQGLYGLGAALAYPAWSSFFTANMKSGERGFQYSLHSSGTSLAAAVTAIVGGLLAEKVGFWAVFVLTSVFALVGLLLLFKLDKKEVLRKK